MLRKIHVSHKAKTIYATHFWRAFPTILEQACFGIYGFSSAELYDWFKKIVQPPLPNQSERCLTRLVRATFPAHFTYCI